MKIEKITHMTIELDFFLHINHPVVSPTRLSKRPLSGLKTMFSMETTSEKHVPNQIDLWVIMRIGGCCCKAEPHTFNVVDNKTIKLAEICTLLPPNPDIGL